MTPQIHREACDECHRRKVRCPVLGPGACSNCQTTGRKCTFSPREDIGRPRKISRRNRRLREHGNKGGSAQGESTSRESSVLDSVDQYLQQPNIFIYEDPHSNHDGGSGWQSKANFSASQPEEFPEYSELQQPYTTAADQMSRWQTMPTSVQHPPSGAGLLEYHPMPTPSATLEPEPTGSGSETCPVPTPTPDLPLAAQSSLGFTWSPNPELFRDPSPNFKLDTYQRLSKVLFDLQNERERRLRTSDLQKVALEEVFRPVSMLCDILQAMLAHYRYTPRISLNDDEVSTMFKLAFMDISMVLDIYQSISQAYSGLDESRRRAADNANPTISSADTSQHLRHILNLTTLDFHLERLYRLYEHVDSSDDSQISHVRAEGAALLELRTSVRVSLERVKFATSTAPPAAGNGNTSSSMS